VDAALGCFFGCLFSTGHGASTAREFFGFGSRGGTFGAAGATISTRGDFSAAGAIAGFNSAGAVSAAGTIVGFGSAGAVVVETVAHGGTFWAVFEARTLGVVFVALPDEFSFVVRHLVDVDLFAAAAVGNAASADARASLRAWGSWLKKQSRPRLHLPCR
jgi:hypothetical protein